MKKVLKKTRVKLILFSSIILFDVSNCMTMQKSYKNNNIDDNEIRISINEAYKNGNFNEVENIVKNLIANGSQEILNIENQKGATLLHMACYFGHLNVVQLLFANCSKDNLNKTTEEGFTPLDYACIKGHICVVQFLLNNGAKESLKIATKKCVTPLNLACINGNLNLVQFLLDNGAKKSLNETDQNGYTPLNLACINGNLNLVQFLLNNGAKKSLNKTALDGTTPLHTACYWGHLDIVKFLLDNGAQENLNMQLNGGLRELPIHLACDYNRLNIIFYLLNKNNTTIEQINSKIIFSTNLFKNKELFELLLNKITDANGNIQLHMLRDKNGDTLESYLIKNPHLISTILSDNRFLYATYYDQTTNNYYESGMRRLVDGRQVDTDDNNIIVRFIKAVITTNELIKTSLKNEAEQHSPETSRKIQILTNFSNNLVNTSIIFNILSGAKAIKEKAEEKYAKKSKVSGDTFLNDEIAMEIMSFGYECFKNPKNRAVINKLKNI